ncbi:peroxidase-like protein [Plakobranchus ocellatus]|uniref:Peroxidase-like protein n=1 Tax=Plakobranchus ocellatus TaxID=259542 RepID=A0AAV4D0U4_9GAST|nr:peroxidase-like protein [Plakobranchus ocellatus]
MYGPNGSMFGTLGDVRVNEHPMLSALHVVFHRYHNYVADLLSTNNLFWDDETVFQETRRIVGAVLQHIVYSEYLPPLLGPLHMSNYDLRESRSYRYEPETDPRVINSFATAAFRFGHSMVPGHLWFGSKKEPLESLFFSPHTIQDNRNSVLASLIKGTLTSASQGSDRQFSPAVSRKLFQDLTTGRSLDLVSLNIQRGRDHGLPSYTAFRETCGLPKLNGTEAETKDFLNVFNHIDDIDLFSGALSETHVLGGVVGPTFACIIAKQFRDLKYGDRFWFENPQSATRFTEAQLRAVKSVSMASILCAVSGISSVPWHAFRKTSFWNPEVECNELHQLDLSPWIFQGI